MHKILKARVGNELAAGRAWRAKELLRGHIGSDAYDVELYEAYADLLARLGELPEAGKYYLLAGALGPEHEEAVELFLARHRKRQPVDVYRAFPSMARLRRLEDYPDAVRGRLIEWGVPQHLPCPRRYEADALGSRGRSMEFGCLIPLALLVVFAAIGFVWFAGTVLQWAF